jgi:hypothetical protein
MHDRERVLLLFMAIHGVEEQACFLRTCNHSLAHIS